MNTKRYDHSRILELRNGGLSIRAIAKEMGCSKGVVEYAIRLTKPTNVYILPDRNMVPEHYLGRQDS